MTEQARQIDRARSRKGDDEQRVHPTLQESLAKHERDSALESQPLFFPGFISRLPIGRAILDFVIAGLEPAIHAEAGG